MFLEILDDGERIPTPEALPEYGLNEIGNQSCDIGNVPLTLKNKFQKVCSCIIQINWILILIAKYVIKVEIWT